MPDARRPALPQSWMVWARAEEDVMHPMFVELYLETSEEDLQAEREKKRRRANRARRARSRTAVRVTVDDRVRRRP